MGRAQKELGFIYFFIPSKFVRCYKGETVSVAELPIHSQSKSLLTFLLSDKTLVSFGITTGPDEHTNR